MSTQHQDLNSAPAEDSGSAQSTPKPIASGPSDTDAGTGPRPLGISFREPAFWVLIAIVAVGYMWRLSELPIHGEESRWARGAVLMIETGDYIVPRQQGKVFPERPPMNSWLMAGLGLVRGEVDVWAVRLPSIFAVILTAAFLYLYTRQFLPVSGAFAAGAIYATFGQVLQIGRLGESEAVLAMFVTGSLLIWHTGYWRQWSPTWTWSLAYSMAAMAALTKGMQGPVYLVVATGAFLVLRRQWRWLISWQHVVGVIVGVAVVATWQVPFYLATDLQAVRDIWTGLVVDRITLQGLLTHLAAYPVETLACLLPWSLMLIQLFHRGFRQQLRQYREPFQFVVMAALLAYPSVWLVTGARGRYYMPLYGCLAVALAVIVQVSMQGEPGSWARRGWIRYARIASIAFAGVAVGLLVVGIVPAVQVSGIEFPILPTLVLLVATLPLLWAAWRRDGAGRNQSTTTQATTTQVTTTQATTAQVTQLQVITLTACLCIAYAVIAPAIATKHGHHVRDNAVAVEELVPADYRWVSFGPVHHRFVYHLGGTVEELDWPSDLKDVPRDVDYFLLDYNVWDSPQERLSGRGRTWTTTPGTLPFEWEEVQRIPMDRGYMESESWVILGRVKWPHDSIPQDPYQKGTADDLPQEVAEQPSDQQSR